MGRRITRNLKLAVTYTLTNSGELRIQYAAQTDKATVLNLTNHSYFNLAGAGRGDILAHRIRIHASRFTPVDKNLIPTGKIKEVAGTPMDLREWTAIGANLQAVGGDPVASIITTCSTATRRAGPALRPRYPSRRAEG